MTILDDRNKCNGCHACVCVCPSNCISMQGSSEGFLYPLIEASLCSNCGVCKKVCPVAHIVEQNNESAAYACINKNDYIRMESSSGGMFTLLANNVLDNGGIVFGAGFDENYEIVHSYVNKKEDLTKFRGSKYVQSKIGNTYNQAKDFLTQEKMVLFSGTPCQIGGLKAFLGQEYKNLFCVDIVCHGVPSPKVWKKYVKYREEKAGAQVRRIAFRMKNEGWKRFSVSFLYKNDTEYRQTLDKDLYMQAFLQNVCLRPSCYECRFKTLNRQSDITLADFWGIENIFPEMDDNKGTSLVLVHSEYGHAMFKRIETNIEFREVDIEKAVKYNSSAIRSVQPNANRDRFFAELDTLSFKQLVKKNCKSVSLKTLAKRLLVKFRERCFGV